MILKRMLCFPIGEFIQLCIVFVIIFNDIIYVVLFVELAMNMALEGLAKILKQHYNIPSFLYVNLMKPSLQKVDNL